LQTALAAAYFLPFYLMASEHFINAEGYRLYNTSDESRFIRPTLIDRWRAE